MGVYLGAAVSHAGRLHSQVELIHHEAASHDNVGHMYLGRLLSRSSTTT